MELQLLQQIIPVVEFNKEELKEVLGQHLEKYSNLVVTEETEKDCKKVKAELAKLEVNVETFRKDVKKVLSEPISKFEGECKELVALIQEVKLPIDNQLKIIEENRKAEKEALINEEIANIIVEFELDAKHAPMLSVNARYLNKTETMSKITTDLKNRAEVLKTAQISIVRNKEIVKTTCEMYNDRLRNKIDHAGWVMVLDNGTNLQDVVAKIHAEGKRRLNQELDEVEKEAQEIMSQPIVEPVIHVEPIKPIELCKEAAGGPILEATLRFYGTRAQMSALRSCMESMGIKYEKVNL